MSVPAGYWQRLSARLVRQFGLHPDERDLSADVLNDAATRAISALEGLELDASELISAMMRDHEPYPLRRSEVRQRKVWSAMSAQAGHGLGDCFDGRTLCGVCSR